MPPPRFPSDLRNADTNLTPALIEAFKANPDTLIDTWWLYHRCRWGWCGPVKVQNIQDGHAHVSILQEDTMFWVPLEAMLVYDYSAFQLILDSEDVMRHVNNRGPFRWSGLRFEAHRQEPRPVFMIARFDRSGPLLYTAGPTPEFEFTTWNWFFVDYESVPFSREHLHISHTIALPLFREEVESPWQRRQREFWVVEPAEVPAELPAHEPPSEEAPSPLPPSVWERIESADPDNERP